MLHPERNDVVGSNPGVSLLRHLLGVVQDGGGHGVSARIKLQPFSRHEMPGGVGPEPGAVGDESPGSRANDPGEVVYPDRLVRRFGPAV